MEKAILDKVRLALAQMNDQYWDGVVSNTSALESQVRQVAGAFLDGYSVLMAAQADALEARYNGYQQLISADESNLPETVKANKSHMTQLEAKRNQAVKEVSGLLEGLQSLVTLGQTLGEPSSPSQKGGGT